MSEDQSKFKQSLYNPSTWISVGAILIALVTAYNTIGANSDAIEVLDSRLDKKISIQNTHGKSIKDLKMEVELLKKDLIIQGLELRLELERVKRENK